MGTPLPPGPMHPSLYLEHPQPNLGDTHPPSGPLDKGCSENPPSGKCSSGARGYHFLPKTSCWTKLSSELHWEAADSQNSFGLKSTIHPWGPLTGDPNSGCQLMQAQSRTHFGTKALCPEWITLREQETLDVAQAVAPWPFGCQIAFEGGKEEGEVFCIGLKGFITLGNPVGKKQEWRRCNNLNKEEVQGVGTNS